MSPARRTPARRRWATWPGSAVVAVFTAALVAAPAGPARAGSTAVAITVLPGPLSISAPLEAGPLTTGPAQDGHTVLGRPRIHDARAVGPDATWVVSITWAVASPLTGPPTDPQISPAPDPKALAGDPGGPTQLGSVVYTERRCVDGVNDVNDVDRRTVTVTGVFAEGQTVGEPTLRLTAPADAAATVTYSVS